LIVKAPEFKSPKHKKVAALVLWVMTPKKDPVNALDIGPRVKLINIERNLPEKIGCILAER
jgi:hypothetical protein